MSIGNYVFSGDVEFADAIGDYIDLVPKLPDQISISKSDVEAMAKHFGLIDEWVSTEDQLPLDESPVFVLANMRYKRYKPNSHQARSGITGRWQECNGYGGWDNCEAPKTWMPMPESQK